MDDTAGQGFAVRPDRQIGWVCWQRLEEVARRGLGGQRHEHARQLLLEPPQRNQTKSPTSRPTDSSGTVASTTESPSKAPRIRKLRKQSPTQVCDGG
eukprot:1181741-Prorocentrum_minimum.AAC.2